MEVLKSLSDLEKFKTEISLKSKTLAFIPTLGSLHSGHLSLVNEGFKRADLTLVSIFVNRSQFNDNKDFDIYPRTIESDLSKLRKSGCTAAFIPSEEEMNSIENLNSFQIGELNEHMEGAYRPGHFEGVANIVYKFFKITKPDYAIFGIKDYQQCLLIKKMVSDLKLPIKLIFGEIIREKEGLAKSSRNSLLSPSESKISLSLSQILTGVKNNLKDIRNSSELMDIIKRAKMEYPGLSLEYLHIVENNQTIPLKEYDQNKVLRACICGRVNDVRLIDNLLLN